MKYPKEMISGKDINLTSDNLGIIKQLTIDDFMGDIDIFDFIKPFFVVRIWDVNGLLNESIKPLTMYLVSALKQSELYESLVRSLSMIYRTNIIKLVPEGDTFTILIKYISEEVLGSVLDELNRRNIKVTDEDIEKAMDRNADPIAIISDDNFNTLAKAMMEMCHYEDPEPQQDDEYEGDSELVKLAMEAERKHEEAERKKNALTFEEIVRQVYHMKRCTYDDIKHLTLWQLQDTYQTYCIMDNNEKEWQLASSGNFKINLKNIKDWKRETKTSRDN